MSHIAVYCVLLRILGRRQYSIYDTKSHFFGPKFRFPNGPIMGLMVVQSDFFQNVSLLFKIDPLEKHPPLRDEY
jgi:hypothetical protein